MADYVVCPNGLVNAGIEIRLIRALPFKFADSGTPSKRAIPWDIETLSGQHYVMSRIAYRGHDLAYRFQPAKARPSLPHHDVANWIVGYALTLGIDAIARHEPSLARNPAAATRIA